MTDFHLVRERGQAVLIVLLTMVVALTVVLSIVSSSSSDIRLSTLESSSQRAFSAAEAGAERALVAGTIGQGSVNTGATYNVNISGLAENTIRYVYPSTLNKGDSGIFWLVDHAADKSLTCSTGNCFTGNRANICWGVMDSLADTTLPTTPALEVSVFYLATPGNYNSAAVTKEIYDPNVARRGVFYAAPSSTNCSILGTSFAFQANITFSNLGVGVSGAQNGLQFISVKPLYSNTPQPVAINVGIAGNTGDLPSQGQTVDSSGSLDNATRRVQVARNFGGLPAPFDAAIFSRGDL